LSSCYIYPLSYTTLFRSVSIPFQSDDVLLQQLCSQLGSSILVCAFQHAALALLRRREGLEDVGRRALQTDGVYLDQRIILQGVRSEEHTSELQSRFDLVC